MLTPKQQQVINFNKGNILVSASAGSGKTFVMVKRILRLIIEEHVNVDEILCVTFTVLAANEMKQKINDAIVDKIKECEDTEDKVHLLKQLDLLPTASISTVHAFCKSLISEFFYAAGVDPSFKIASDVECEKLVKRAIDRLFEDLYDKDDQDLNTLLPIFFKGRSDSKLKEKIKDVYYKIISEADPEKVLKDGEFYYTEEGVESILDELNQMLHSEMTAFADRMVIYAEHFAGFTDFELYLADIISELYSAASGETLEQTLANIDGLTIKKPKKKPSIKDEKYTMANMYAEIVSKKFSAFKKAKKTEYASCDIEKEKFFAQKNIVVYKAFSNLVVQFMQYYKQEKQDENLLDFSDLEHITLKLLQNEEIKQEVRLRFKYIFTDEYQDTSGVQEEILSAVSDCNLFMVGDIKQNIYDFRGCDSSIFAGKKKTFLSDSSGVVVDLDQNFRSSSAVINAVNNVFTGVMTEKCCGVNYAENPMIFGADYSPCSGEVKYYAVEKCVKEDVFPEGVYSVVKHLKNNESNTFFAEGAFIATLINQLVGKQIEIGSGGKTKKLEYGDIAILLRNANSVGDDYAKELIASGIPVSANSKTSIGEYGEIAFLVDLVKLISCFNQDIPLASVLKSPIGGLTDAELFAIRKAYDKVSFVDAYRSYCTEKDDDLSDKLKKFDEYFAHLRLRADFMPCDELLASVIRENAIDVKVLASKTGELKLARINAFISASGAKGKTAKEFAQEMSAVIRKLTVNYDDDNAVKIMSVHASKGLEYPVVILAGTIKEFNDTDKAGNFIYDRKFGVAMSYYDPQEMIVNKTAFIRYMRKKLIRNSREEEARILYVAMTRAKHSLYITGEYRKNAEHSFKAKHYDGEGYDAKSFFDFFAEGDFCYEDIGCFEQFSENKRGQKEVIISEKDEELASIIKNNLSFNYGAAGESLLSVKRSVTAAAHFEEEDGINYERRPIYGASNAETGTAYHKFLQYCDFSKDVESEINRLIGGDLFVPEEKKLLNTNKMRQILSMDIFRKIQGYRLYKEQPFTAFISGKLIEPDYNGDGEVLVQGIIDLLCVKGDEVIIIDYKHTTISSDEQLKSIYAKQLELYAYAVEKVLLKKVTKCYLVNIYSMHAIEVEI